MQRRQLLFPVCFTVVMCGVIHSSGIRSICDKMNWSNRLFPCTFYKANYIVRISSPTHVLKLWQNPSFIQFVQIDARYTLRSNAFISCRNQFNFNVAGSKFLKMSNESSGWGIDETPKRIDNHIMWGQRSWRLISLYSYLKCIFL